MPHGEGDAAWVWEAGEHGVQFPFAADADRAGERCELAEPVEARIRIRRDRFGE